MHTTLPQQPKRSRLAEFLLQRGSNLMALHVAFALFVVGSVTQSLWHGPWRDEAQAWLMARDLSVGQLFIDARHDGHPILWHLCLKVVQALGMNYVGMELLNSAFICGAVWLLFYRSNLPLLARLAFAFCPACLMYVAYYGRNYAIASFLLFLAAMAYRNFERRPILFATLLVLVAHTNLYGTAVFAGAAFQFMLEQTFRTETGRFSLRPLYTRYLAPNLVLAFGALLVVLAVIPMPGLFPPPRPEPVSAALTAITPAPDLPGWEKVFQHIESAHVFKSPPQLWIYLLLAPALLLFLKSPGPRRIYGIAVMLLASMVVIAVYPASSRHLFVLTSGAIYFTWIYWEQLRLPSRTGTASAAGWLTAYLVALCLITQQERLDFASANRFDGRGAAQAIIDHHLDTTGTVMVTTEPNRAISVLMPLSHIHDDYRPGPWPEARGAFADMSYYRERKRVPLVRDIEPMVLEVAAANPDKTVVVVSSNPNDNSVTETPNPACPLHLIYRSPYDPASADDVEAFQVYVLERP
jgi:hypothetical protein